MTENLECVCFKLDIGEFSPCGLLFGIDETLYLLILKKNIICMIQAFFYFLARVFQ